jgi:hypothetical protein
MHLQRLQASMELLVMNDSKFLTWIYYRLKNVHGENENYDYMIRLKKYIDALIEELNK